MSAEIKGIRCLLHLIKSGVSQGSILGPIFFNIFMNHLFYLLEYDLYNFADDNSVSAVIEIISGLINLLTSDLAIDWFQTNSKL